MWSPRKGARDWPAIIQRVWQRHPQARFRFLGTMVEPEVVASELGLGPTPQIQVVTEYAPGDLPKLLASSTVGAFPSYVEGFGLAVLEQLAAGIPTVAFDVPGPRDILRSHLSDLLVADGQIENFADAICRVLQLDRAEYEQLSRHSREMAGRFDWSKIAHDTIDIYRQHLARKRRPIFFVQPFTLGLAGGGGGRILRALLEDAPCSWQSVCCAPQRPPHWPNERHLPARPSWGRIERSRLAMFPKMTGWIFERSFQRRLRELCQKEEARAIHTVPHSGLDFAHAQAVARDLGLPFFITLHDDLAYTGVHEAGQSRHGGAMRTAWQGADARFVISDALGREYARRYGERPFQVVTDGRKRLSPARCSLSSESLRIYFMGLFHLSYERNLRALLEGIRLFENKNPSVRVTMTCRCEHVRPRVWKDLKEIKVLPYADEAQIERDMEEADLLYMPMPFGREHENFARYSVSTKMVTYIGSGLPILYHGPASSAAFEILQRNHAAIFVNTLLPTEIAQRLSEITPEQCENVVRNALALAGREFMLSDQKEKFWGTVAGCLKSQ